MGRLQRRESSTDPSEESEVFPAKLNARLQLLVSKITKMDDTCMEGLGPDLAELNSSLAPSEQNVDILYVSM